MRSPLFEGLLGATRRVPRRRMDLRHSQEVSLAIIAEGRTLHGQSVDLGLAGLCADLGGGAVALHAGSEVTVALSLPGLQTPLRAPARVCWVAGQRAGLAFRSPSPRLLWSLHRLFP